MKTTQMATLTPVDFNPFEEDKKIEKITLTNDSQREIWLSCVIGGNEANLSYNESVSLVLEGTFHFEFFREAINKLVLRHEALRSVISPDGEYLIIYENLPVDFFLNDLTTTDSSLRQQLLSEYIEREINTVFDLDKGPLFKVLLHKIDELRHCFTIIKHHAIGDGWSTGIMLEDLSQYYNGYLRGREIDLPRAHQISDYVTEQNHFKSTLAYKDTESYWLNLYGSDIPLMNLPTDHPRQSPRSYSAKRIDYRLSGELLNKIKSSGAKAGASLVTTLLAAFEILLYNKTLQSDIIVGLPASGQLATGLNNVVGHCVNLLPLKTYVDPTLPFIDYLKSRKRDLLDAYDHQRITFGELIKKLFIPRDPSRVTLVPVIFNMDMGMDQAVSFDNLTHSLVSNARSYENFEIYLNVTGSKNGTVLEWSYNTQLFTSSTIDKMMQDFELVLQKIVREPDALIKNILQHNNPFPTISHHKVDRPLDITFVDLFKDCVDVGPEKIAVVFEGSQLKYRQLDEKSNQLANYLIGKGIGAEDIVPICILPSLEMIIGILGILKAGAAYAPIDPELPAQRVNYILSDTAAKVIITDFHNFKKLEDITTNELLIVEDQKSELWKASTIRPNTIVTQSNLMYVIYTSGSTGNPKGVLIEHGDLVDYLFGLKSKLPLLESCKSFALGSSIATDLGNTILYSSLVKGGTLHVFAKDRFNNAPYIHDYFYQNSIDCLKIVPSHWKSLMEGMQNLFPKHC